MNAHVASWSAFSKVLTLNGSGRKHVALVAGGTSDERKASLSSSKEVIKALFEAGYKVTYFDMGADIAIRLDEIKPDLVFNCLHGKYGKDGCLPGLLNIMQIPYTHSGLLASSMSFNKIQSRYCFMANDINMADGVIINKTDNMISDPLDRPYIIKPIDQGASIGIIVVFEEDIFQFLNYDFAYGDQVLIEKYVKGQELQVAVLSGKAIGALETKVEKNRFYDHEAKCTEGLSKHMCPASLPKDVYRQLLFDAEKIFKTMNCKGAAIAKFILEEKTNKLFALGINTHPEMTTSSVFPKIAAHKGIGMVNLIEEILKTPSFEN